MIPFLNAVAPAFRVGERFIKPEFLKLHIMKQEQQEQGSQVYRKLYYYFENKIPIHFCLVRGGWKNGLILDLNEQKLTLVLSEFVEGTLPFLCEEIDFRTIEEFRRKS